MSQEAFLGIDVGTSSVKAVLISPGGKAIATASSPLTVNVPAPGWSEQNPTDWWDATVKAVREAVSSVDNVTVRGIGLSGQMHSLVALDKSGAPVRPAILWNDVRTTEQCAYIRERIGDSRLRDLCGNPALEGFTATKLLWMREHEPESFSRISTALLPKDYVRFRMTEELATDPSDAAATLLFDVKRAEWSDEMLRLLSLDRSFLPPVVGSSEIAGRLHAEAADSLGVPVGTPVVGGGADNACAATGAGVVSSGDLLVSSGTSGTVVAPVSEPLVDSGMRIHSMNHVERDTWYLMGVVLSAGAALAWWRETAAGGNANPSFDQLVTEAEAVEPGSDGLTFLPYLTGERTPHADANARGVFAGMHAGHTRSHMTRSVLEGVSFALLDSLNLIRDLGVSPKSAVAVGGGAQSPVWLQMQADVLGVSMQTVGPTEGAPLGAAMLAAVGAGEFGSVSEAGDAWLESTGAVDPNLATADRYKDAYGRYRSLYASLMGWFAE